MVNRTIPTGSRTLSLEPPLTALSTRPAVAGAAPNAVDPTLELRRRHSVAALGQVTPGAADLPTRSAQTPVLSRSMSAPDMHRISLSSITNTTTPARSPSVLSVREQQRNELIMQLTAWANEPVQASERRNIALSRLLDYLDCNEARRPVLYLHSLGLTRLPVLPSDVCVLDISDNLLREVQLPPRLTRLKMNSNRFETLPPLPHTLIYLEAFANHLTEARGIPPNLEFANLSHNQIQTWPDFGAAINTIYMNDNLLVDCPHTVFPNLRELDLKNNWISNLGSALFETSNCELVSLEGNPLSQNIVDAAMARCNSNDYIGPSFFFSMDSIDPQLPPSHLEAAVAEFFSEPEGIDQAALWTDFNQELGAAEFSYFLDNLRGTVNYCDSFRENVCSLLGRMAIDPILRHDCFTIALDASTRCEDRVTIRFHEMEAAHLNAQARSGDFDHQLPELIHRISQLFRREALHDIARTKMASMSMVDEVEVYLAYLAKLNHALDLGLAGSQMRFEHVSGVSDDDLAQALTQVKAMDESSVLHYLFNKSPILNDMFKRLDPGEHQAMTEILNRAFSGEPQSEFQLRLNARMAELPDLSGIAQIEAERGPSADITRELQLKIMLPFFTKFLKSHQVSPAVFVAQVQAQPSSAL